MGGTYKEIIIIEGSCDQLDTTPPVLSITSNLVTSSSITIVATAEDLESGINGYQFSKDNGTTWTSKQISNVYNFTGLTNNTNYTFKVRVYNNNELSTVSEELIVRTNDIAIPTYSINTTDWSPTKIVTITYPERQAGFVYEYSLDGATTWLLVEAPSTTKEITFTDNGSVIARITDGTNEISGTSYQVTNIDKVDPTVSMNVVGSPFNANGWSKTNFDINIETTDLESGISNYKYCQTTSSSCTPSTTVNNASGVVTITTESATNKVCVQAYDNANNSSEVVCTNSYKLDKTSPTAGTISLSGTLGSNGWYTSNVTVNKTDGSDTLSGHATTTLSHTSITSETTGITVTLTTTDQAGNTATRTELVKVDKTAPIAGTISLSGTLGTNGWYRSNVTVSKTDGSDTISGHASTTLSHTSITTDTSGVTITLTTTNNAGLTSTATQTVKVDKTNPAVTFGTNGNSTYAKSRSTTVSVSDALSGLLSGSLKYLWNTSTTTPSEASFTTTFNSGNTISSPAGVTGGYYLWILGKDNAGNTIITRSNVFNLDNTIPVITVNPTTVTIALGGTYTDAGVTASDNINGNITASIVRTGTLNTNAVGTYTLTYNVSDSSGNAAVSKTRTVIVVQSTYNYAYTGSVQSVTLQPGTYTLETWGANGGGGASYYPTAIGGTGGYSKGTINLTQATTMYILVGGRGTNYGGGDHYGQSGGYNGGGSNYVCYSNGLGSGGGASDIRVLANNLYNRIIVAGGGGGAGNGSTGGHGGGSTGGSGNGNGGTQTAGGSGQVSGSFGQGGGSTSDHGSYNGGGGGWYGGGSSTSAGAGGGSGYVLTSSSHKPSGYFAQNASYFMTNPVSVKYGEAGFVTNPVSTGHGYVRITFVP
jgi:hypothetical protein